MKLLFLLWVIEPLVWCDGFVRPSVPISRGERLFAGNNALQTDVSTVKVLDEVGRGSYGTVHICSLDGESRNWIGKRAWTEAELADLEAGDDQKERAQRCQYYWSVEEHCFSKLGEHPQLPFFKGSFRDGENRAWMLFSIIQATTEDTGTGDEAVVQPAPSLADIMKKDHKNRNDLGRPHHLYNLQQALGLEPTAGLVETLDVFMESLLSVLCFVHSKRVVHRDVKPSNLLISKSGVSLIDFGSAAALDPSPGIFKKRVGLEDGNRVAVSPIYAAPEIFINIHNEPTNFDVFSAALIYCQLLNDFLDERTDAGFHQQLEQDNFCLDDWLDQTLAAKVRPSGLTAFFDVLGERPGLFRLLSEMIRPDPWERINSEKALKRLKDIIAGNKVPGDGEFFASVVQSADLCEVSLPQTRALHFVATFRRNAPLGLLLAEAAIGDDELDEMSEEARILWIEATKDALPGQVFVKGIVEGSQAAELDVFSIGDQLQGVGELPLQERGFEKVLELLENQPASSKYVTIHFDRKSSRSLADRALLAPLAERPTFPRDSGAWSAKGKRKYQEDRFVLHEIDRVLVAAVADGHGGTAAAEKASSLMPDLIAEQLLRNPGSLVGEVLENAWNTVCSSYQEDCQDDGSCIADYDPREGNLVANTGSDELVAGTTCSAVAVDESNGKITFLNCGDSRSLLVSKTGKMLYETLDHTPEVEMTRLNSGKDRGLDYSIPECSMGRWSLKIGDYRYAVARSLEGPFATSRGIVFSPDVTTLQAEPGATIVCASDGLWEVIDSSEAARVVNEIRSRGTTAGDAAKTLCSMALEKGTSDNVSAVVVYLD